MRRRAYTLVEICIVVFIIGLLSSTAYMQYKTQSDAANQGAATANLNKIRAAINSFFNDTGLYPSSLSDLTLSTAPSTGFNNAGTSVSLNASLWNGPYLREVDVEPVYGTSYTYSSKTRGSGVYYTVDPTNWSP